VINASKNRFAASHIAVTRKASQMLRKNRPSPSGKSGKVEDLGILHFKTTNNGNSYLINVLTNLKAYFQIVGLANT